MSESSKADVEEFARAMHEANRVLIYGLSWEDISAEARERYLGVAARLLADPPEVMRWACKPAE